MSVINLVLLALREHINVVANRYKVSLSAYAYMHK
jgi:hypothetical protein